MITVTNSNFPLMAKDQLNLEKYLEHFALKTIQSIVQSRNGAKKRSYSKAKSSTSDWFCVAVEDDVSIHAKGKKFLQNRNFLTDFCLCIEIQLQTVDNDKLILETWSLNMKERPDPSITVTSVYPRMTVLLKSLVAVSRVTPAYKLSSRQSDDSYTILYRFYFGPPEIKLLGEGYEQCKIGEVVTPVGIMAMTLAYRTKMTITPQTVEKESPFMVKSDYFKPDMSPKRLQATNGFPTSYNREDSPGRPCGKTTNGYRTKYPTLFADSEDLYNGDKINDKCRINSSVHPEDFRISGAFAPTSKLFPDPSSFPDLVLPDTPILNLVSSSSRMKALNERQSLLDPVTNNDRNANMSNENLENGDDVDFNCNTNDQTGKMMCSGSSECGDFVMVELRPAFARNDSNNDLGVFFRDCQSAPPLASFETQPSLGEQVSDITNQLAKFEVSLPDFDTFVDEMCKVEAAK